jgi:hypothetical protein
VNGSRKIGMFQGSRSSATPVPLSLVTGGETMLAGWKRGEIRSKMFRHTHCSARLMTLDQEAPVSIYQMRLEALQKRR